MVPIDETGLRAGGVHDDLDCIIFASGFAFNTDDTNRSAFEVCGHDGQPVTSKSADGTA
ncbi:MAG: hypothetical protein QM733_16220 [Ilumatobacteraceae bacterium]